MIYQSSFEYSYLWLPLIGFIIGLLASMLGGGGGFTFLLILVLLFRIPAQTAVATSLAATLPICIVGAFRHHHFGNVDLRIGLIFAVTGIIGAIMGAGLTSLLTTTQLKTCFGIYSILIALQMVSGNMRKKRAEDKGIEIPEESGLRKTTKGSIFGFIAGVITGTFGTSGTAPVLAGLFSIHMPVKMVVGTSLMIAFVNTVSALGAHFVVGEIDLTLVWFLVSGSLIGAFSGPKLLAGIKVGNAENPIRQFYAFAMIIFGIILIISANR